MEDRDHHDTKVVSLRRKADPRGRDQVAGRIFAEQDEIGTFSQGNLVPPTPPAPDTAEESGQAADPFFEEHVPHANGPGGLVSDAEVGTDADDYFAQLGEQSATQMADRLCRGEQSRAIAMPGSAGLPVDAAKGRRHRRRLERSMHATRGQLLRAVASRSVLLGMSTALLASAALVLVVVFLGNQSAAAPSRGVGPPLASTFNVDRNPFKLNVSGSSQSARGRSGSRHASRRRGNKAADRVRKAVRVDRARRSGTPANVSQATSISSAGSTTGSPVSSSPAPSDTPAQNGNSSSGQGASSSSSPAFGLNGALGPGHSSIG